MQNPSTLYDKTRNETVKDCRVVIILHAQLDEIATGQGCLFWLEILSIVKTSYTWLFQLTQSSMSTSPADVCNTSLPFVGGSIMYICDILFVRFRFWFNHSFKV